MNLTKKQQEIIDTKDKTMLVSASAGSGKTFVVVEKIVNTIIHDRKSIDTFLIVTFTNAAASELKERIVLKLQEALKAANEEGDVYLARFLSSQITKAWNANISTIHSFCLSVIKDNFYILGVDPNVTTLDATRASIMLGESISEIIEEEYDKKSEEFFDILEILGSEEELISITLKFYDFYTHVIDKEKFKFNVLKTYELKDVKDLTDTEFGKSVIYDIKSKVSVNLSELEQGISSIDGVDEFLKHKEILNMLKAKLEQIINAQTYDDIFNLLNNLLELPKMPRYSGTDIETKDNINTLKKNISEDLKSYTKIIYKNTEGIVKELNDMRKYIVWLFSYIEKVKKTYSEKKRKKSVIDFNDYEELTIEALKNEEVVNKYKAKFETIYVDEYQDTSYAQEAVISKISKENNCIMVGDVKQSIYGFRNAAPELFSSKYENFSTDGVASDNIKIVLSQNFRSRKEVIESINNIFENIMSLEFGGARYTDTEKLIYGEGYETPENSHEYITEVNIIEKTSIEEEEEEKSSDKIDSIQLEANVVANRIKKLVKEFNVYDPKKKEYRKCEYKDIVILLQTAVGVAQKIADVLKENQIPVYASTKTSFYETDEIKLVMSFLKVLDNPYDDIPLASVMYSKIGMFTIDDLTTIRLNSSNSMLYNSLQEYVKLELDKQDIELTSKIQMFLELLERFKKYINTYNLSHVISKLYEETKIYEQIMLEQDGLQKKLNMEALIQIAKDFESTQSPTIYLFIQYIEAIRKKESATEGPQLVGENENTVRIMTIHHSKGLEFPVVILMNMAKPYIFPDVKDKVLLDNSLGVGVNVLDKNLNITYPSIINMAIKANIKYRQKSELLRLLYVALTRAKEKLIIYGTVKDVPKYISKIQGGIVDGKATRSAIIQNNSHLKNILIGLLSNTSQDSFEINIVDGNVEINGEDGIDTLNYLETFKGKYNENIDKEKLDKEYKKYNFENKVSQTLQKYTATNINGEHNGTPCISQDTLKPKVLEEKVDSKGFGTLIHKVVERLNLKVSTKDNVISTTENVIEELQVKNANVHLIADKIMEMIKVLNNAFEISKSKIYKEYHFIIKSDLKDLDEIALLRPSLIQGVIDMYIESGTRNIIVDFKTDRLEECELKEKYSVQLAIYKKGIEQSLNKTDVEVYIYSFALGKLIKIPV